MYIIIYQVLTRYVTLLTLRISFISRSLSLPGVAIKWRCEVRVVSQPCSQAQERQEKRAWFPLFAKLWWNSLALRMNNLCLTSNEYFVFIFTSRPFQRLVSQGERKHFTRESKGGIQTWDLLVCSQML